MSSKEQKYVAELITEHYRGDHCADVRYPFTVDPNETVGDMLKRIRLEEKHEHIEIRILSDEWTPRK